jgi:hypothetical protein
VIKIEDKMLKVSFEAWDRIRTFAFHNNSKMKAVVDDILKGKIDPLTGKTI